MNTIYRCPVSLRTIASRSIQILLFAVFSLSASGTVHAIPFACSSGDSDKRLEYVCAMLSRKTGPNNNYWRMLRALSNQSSDKLATYIKKQGECTNKIVPAYNTCQSKCLGKPGGEQTVKCKARCEKKREKDTVRCQRSDFGTNIDKIIAYAKKPARKFKASCEASFQGSECEWKEAKPYCEALGAKASTYYVKMKSVGKDLKGAADAFSALKAEMNIQMNARQDKLGGELIAAKAAKKKCDEKYLEKDPVAQDEKPTCILPEPDLLASLRRKYAAPAVMSSLFQDFGPDEDTIGTRKKLCFDDKRCDDTGAKLINPMTPWTNGYRFNNGTYLTVAVTEGFRNKWPAGSFFVIDGYKFEVIQSLGRYECVNERWTTPSLYLHPKFNYNVPYIDPCSERPLKVRENQNYAQDVLFLDVTTADPEFFQTAKSYPAGTCVSWATSR